MTHDVGGASGKERYIIIFHVVCLHPYRIPAIRAEYHPRYGDQETENRDYGAGGIVQMERTASRRRRVATVDHTTLSVRHHTLLHVGIQRVVIIVSNSKTADGAEVVAKLVDDTAHAEANW